MTRPEKYAGYVAVPRWLLDDDRLASEPFTEVQAVIDMAAMSAWKPRQERIGRAVVDLGRGQFAASTRFLADRWGWSEARVRRFFVRISQRRTSDAPSDARSEPRNDALIDAVSTRDITIVTIRNYDEFNKSKPESETAADAPSDAPKDAQGDAPHVSESTQNKEINLVSNNTPLSEESGTTRANPVSNVIELPRQKSEQAKIPTAAELTTVVGALFGECRKFLVSAGVPDRSARSVVGKWRREHTDDEIFEAVKRAQSEEAQDPVAFISGCLKRKPAAAMVGVESALAALEALR
ncbi:hypothetical protein [Bradyrhizobium sp. LA6.12]|uniref:hypothetical protein n=1 Tax=unclassified Bradyrhizobium TaxID=2631580 RepID=UPI00339A033E